MMTPPPKPVKEPTSPAKKAPAKTIIVNSNTDIEDKYTIYNQNTIKLKSHC